MLGNTNSVIKVMSVSAQPSSDALHHESTIGLKYMKEAILIMTDGSCSLNKQPRKCAGA